MNFKTLATITGLATSATVVLGTLPAQAEVSFTSGGNTCSYCVALDEVYTTTGGGVVDSADDKPNVYLTPGSDTGTFFDDVDDSDNVVSYSVTSTQDDPEGAASDIVVSDLDGIFEFFWGSVDTYNLATFYLDGEVVDTWSGTEIAEALGFTAEDANDAGNFNFDVYALFEGDFNAVVLSSTGIAFEAATEKQAVPEPAALLGLVTVGMVGGGSLLRRSREVA